LARQELSSGPARASGPEAFHSGMLEQPASSIASDAIGWKKFPHPGAGALRARQNADGPGDFLP
jgi:hypothetical protein